MSLKFQLEVMVARIFKTMFALAFLGTSAEAAPVTFAPTNDTYVYSFDQGPPIFNGPATRSIGNNTFIFSTLLPSFYDGAIDYVDPINLGSTRGFWSQRGFSFVGGFNTIRFEFLQMISSVGGVMNYSAFGDLAVMRIRDQNLNVLEEVNVKSAYPIILPQYNRGEYRGFQRGSSDIKYFELAVQGGGMVIDELTISASPAVVPLPTSAWFLLSGLALLLTGALRRKRNAT